MPRPNQQTDLTVALLMLGAWIAYGTLRYWNDWPIDLSALWMAGRLWDLGDVAHLYEAPTRIFSKDFPARWTAELEAAGYGDMVALPFVYPPVWAWMLSVLGQIEPLIFFNIGQFVLFAASAAAVLLLWRLGRPALSATTFAIVTVLIAEATIPYHFAALLGQPQLLLIFLVVLSMERYAAGARRVAAIALGLAAAIKVMPVILVLVFVAERDWRTSAETLAVAAAMALLSLLVAGVDPHLAFVERVREINALAPMIGLNVTFEAMLHMEVIPAEVRAGFRHPYVGDDIGWINGLNTLGLLAATAAAFRAGAGFDLRGRLVIRMTALSLAMALFGPLYWMHYYTLPVMTLLLLPSLIGWARTLAVAIPVLIVLFLPVTFAPNALIVLDFVYPTGYWLAFAWFFVVLAASGRPPLVATAPAVQPAE